MSAEPSIHRPFDTRRLGSEAVLERIVADPGECRSIAAFLDILGVDRLEADLSIAPWGRSGVRIDGRLRAAVTQACVVTLDPVAQTIDQDFQLTFQPPQARAADPRTVAEAEVIVHFDEDDPPDPLEGPLLDLGPLIVEQLSLALDPYPRSEGAVLAESKAEGDAIQSPFAALSRLRDK